MLIKYLNSGAKIPATAKKSLILTPNVNLVTYITQCFKPTGQTLSKIPNSRFLKKIKSFAAESYCT